MVTSNKGTSDSRTVSSEALVFWLPALRPDRLAISFWKKAPMISTSFPTENSGTVLARKETDPRIAEKKDKDVERDLRRSYTRRSKGERGGRASKRRRLRRETETSEGGSPGGGLLIHECCMQAKATPNPGPHDQTRTRRTGRRRGRNDSAPPSARAWRTRQAFADQPRHPARHLSAFIPPCPPHPRTRCHAET